MFRTVVDIYENSFQSYSDHVALRWRGGGKDFSEKTYRELSAQVDAIGAALIKMGIKPKHHIGLVADVSQDWSTACAAIQMMGCVDVPRGTDSTGDELAYILSHSESEVAFVKNSEEVDKIEAALKKVRHKLDKYIVLDDSLSSQNSKKCVKLSELIAQGESLVSEASKEVEKIAQIRKNVQPSDLCTIIYTSGTTGEPKGVQLTHANLASQVNILTPTVGIFTSDRALNILPPWHIFGRVNELLMLANGASLTYTEIKELKNDMVASRPTIIPAVPRIWEGVYNGLITKIKKEGKLGIFNFFKTFSVSNSRAKTRLCNREKLYEKRNIFLDVPLRLAALIVYLLTLPFRGLGHLLIFRKIIAATGGSLRFSISGGGALPGYVDDFFAAVGIKILEGYGLTETSPVLSVRRPDQVTLGTVGHVIDETEFKLIDQNGKDVTRIPGAKGTLHVRGPQVMKGYYKNPQKTQEVLTSDGWLNTGDLVKLTYDKQITIVGRSKDTIVLRGAENVEPTPIEDKAKESPYIDNIMCVGQDEKSVGALVVPNEDELQAFAKDNDLPNKSLVELLKSPKVNALYRSEISRLVSTEAGFKAFERISVFRLIAKPFEKGDELNNTLKVLRHVVSDKYKELIDEMYR